MRSAGAITAGGTLGILIPTSVMLIATGPVIGVSTAFGPGLPAALIGATLGSILAGLATPTEASALGASLLAIAYPR